MNLSMRSSALASALRYSAADADLITLGIRMGVAWFR